VEEETRRAVLGYFEAWTSRDTDRAYALLAPDLEFVGPTARYASAEAFRPALINFAAMTRSAKLVELMVVGDRAAMLYDCELPDPVGPTRIASFFRVQDGKIAWYETLFDATELRKVLPKR
jgi:ketosteroid isomerase-like protein